MYYYSIYFKLCSNKKIKKIIYFREKINMKDGKNKVKQLDNKYLYLNIINLF